MFTNNPVIYCIKNIINNKIYIGSAKNFRIRRNLHLLQLKKNKHHSIVLQRAWNKYGENNFEFIELTSVLNLKDLIKIEQLFIDELKPQYNICPIANSSLGVKRSKITREKISKSQLGRKYSKERKLQISNRIKGENNPFYGKKHKSVTLKKLRKPNKDYKFICLEDEIIFTNTGDASRYYGIPSSNIWKCLKGQRKSLKGKHFKLI